MSWRSRNRIPAGTRAQADYLVEFSFEELQTAIEHDLVLRSEVKDLEAALERGLMFLHEQRVLTLQQGLAVFRSAMTIRLQPEAKGERYQVAHYQPLRHHYRERVLQVHVMAEYARSGLERIREALALMLAYFTLDKTTFIRRFLGDQTELLEQATTARSYQRIVTDLGHPGQIKMVAAPPSGNRLILAGPGSGKTRTIVHRCAYLLRVKRLPPRSILVCCFNRQAALELRRRLGDLVGTDARGVTILTYHSLALRLLGRTLSGTRAPAAPDLDALIPEAVALLRGERVPPGLEPDEVRERLLAGFQHILVDEYQDIDEPQYELIGAIAGRTLADADQKLSVLARHHRELARVRDQAEQAGIPVRWWADRHKMPPLHQVREIHQFLHTLGSHPGRLSRASDWLARIEVLPLGAGGGHLPHPTGEAALPRPPSDPAPILPQPSHPWLGFIRRTLEDWQCETGNAELPTAELREFIYEACADGRREFTYGEGVMLSTVHSAKGTEYDHVLLAGPWPVPAEAPANAAAREEERRAFYVGMTRARLTLAVFDPLDHRPSLAADLDGRWTMRRRVDAPDPAPDPVGNDYALLGLEDINLGYPSLFDADHPLHAALAQLQPGDRLTLHPDDSGLLLCDSIGLRVARLSRSAAAQWQNRLATVRAVRVVAMIRRQADQDDDPDRRQRCRVREWEVPLVEMVARGSA